jgi:hypothetical protein
MPVFRSQGSFEGGSIPGSGTEEGSSDRLAATKYWSQRIIGTQRSHGDFVEKCIDTDPGGSTSVLAQMQGYPELSEVAHSS